MATIGRFTKKGDSYEGFIETRLWHDTAAIVKVVNKPNDKAPDYRVLAGRYEIGAAWQKTSESKTDYLSVTLDDPGFTAPIKCSLLKGQDGFDLIWTRS